MRASGIIRTMKMHGNKGKKHTSETIEKMKKTRKGTYTGDKNHMWKKQVSIETKRKISLAGKGRKFSKEHKIKIGKSNKGKRLGMFATIETRRVLSEQRKGEKSHLWKGGLTSINNIARNSLEYKLWREAVFERDNYTWIWCGDSKGGNLNADHIKPFAHYPELRFAIDNGRTLCIPCHRTTDTYGNLSNNHKKI